VKRLILFGLLGGLLATNTGCGLLQAVFCYRPCATRGDCDVGFAGEGCDEGCGPTCGSMGRAVRGPACAPRRARGVADCDTGCDVACGRPCGRATCRTCSPCGDPCADPCGEGCCGRVWHRGPLSCLFALFMRGSWCGPSCGERYWGDFYSDPPDCWDPCDNCYGNYTGRDGCRSCGGSGCRSCGGSAAGFDGYSRGAVGGRVDDGVPVAGEDNVVSQTDRVVNPAPRPAAQPHRATRP
jgi:hypothetical protein